MSVEQTFNGDCQFGQNFTITFGPETYDIFADDTGITVTAGSSEWCDIWNILKKRGKHSAAAEVIRDWWINVYYAPDVGPYSSVLEASFESLKLRAKDRQTPS